MTNEKMTVLKMLEEQKITSAEAAQLLQSLENGTPISSGTPMPTGAPPSMPSMPTPPAGAPSMPVQPYSASPVPPPAAPSPAPVPPPRPYDGFANNGPAPYKTAPGSAPAHPAGPSRVEEIASDLGRRFEDFARNMEPKLQKFTETVAAHIVTGADKLSKTINTEIASAKAHHPAAPTPYRPSPPPQPAPAPAPAVRPAPAPAARPAPPPTGRYAAPPSAPVAAGMIERDIEITITEGYNELNMSGLNGDINIKGYNGDKITAKLSYKPLRAGAAIDLRKLGGKYYLSYDQDEFERVSIDAYVPERLFQVVKIDNINGQVDVSSLAAQHMEITNGNGHIRLSRLAAANIKAENSQGRFILSNIAADSAVIENVNGIVEAEETDIANFKLTNYNGALTLLMSVFARYNDYIWAIETGNSKLNMTLPAMPDLGYHIKAHTTLGEIRLGLTGLQFLVNDPSMTEARSIQFDSAIKKVRLTAETSNGPLMIN